MRLIFKYLILVKIKYLIMGNQPSIKKINFEDMQQIIHDNKYVIISTLPSNNQDCLIFNTILFNEEENIINDFVSNNNNNTNIIIYGKNSDDMTIYDKYNQIVKLGFINVYIYPGGIFEWVCLQDIYSEELFKTTKTEPDILKYKPNSILNKKYITY